MKAIANKVESKVKWLILTITVLYTLGNLWAIAHGIWWLSLLPLALALLLLLVLKPLEYWLLLVFLTPFSAIIDVHELGSSLSLPTEPLIMLLFLMLLIKSILNGIINPKYIKHPITLIVISYVIWMIITSFFSSIPLVSFKAVLARFWYIIVFFFFGIAVFEQRKNIQKFIWAYVLGMGIVIIYSIIRHSQEFFSHKYSYYAALPFFKDHNIYAVIVAFFIFMLAIMLVKHKTFKYGLVKTTLLAFLLGLYSVGVVLSYTRAAWVSLAAALLLLLFVLLKVRLRTLIIATVSVGLITFFSWNQIMLQLSKNKEESASNMDAHVKSIYNIKSDDSNTERINRWTAAYRMFLERPLFGWGLNTYQFKYAPFQLSTFKTKISTNQGNLGNAHSEYIGPLAEMGLIGLLLVIALTLAFLHYGMKIYYQSPKAKDRYLALGFLLGLFSYYIHGLLNNYLDIDKANVIIWASFAVLVVFDVRRKEIMDKK